MPKKYARRSKRRGYKRGGDGDDLEKGPEPNFTPMDKVPADPERFKTYNKQFIGESFKPISREEATAFFAGPNPEQKMRREQNMMFNEDPQNLDPFDKEQLNIFGERGGRKRRTRKKRRHHKRKSSRRR